MNNKTQWVLWQHLLGLILAGFLLPAQTALAIGGIATDGTMGAAQTLSGTNVPIPYTLGQIRGDNLFHSFSDFNINTGQTVTFTGGDNLQNVISRVTGGNTSNIDGKLRSEIKNADFYFINPNGITFGADAKVDVPGAFHISTADKINFANNSGAFYADRSQNTLSSEAPAAFGFLGTSVANNGLIGINNANLEVETSQTLDMVAGGISVDNQSQITAPAGEVRLVALQGEGAVSLEPAPNRILPLPTASPSSTNAGRIAVNSSAINTSGNGSGRIALWGGNTSFTNSTAYDDNNGSTDATSAKGVDIRALSLKMDDSWITTDTEGAGKAANIRMETTDSLVVDNGRGIKSHAFDEGNAGNVTLQAGTLDILNGGNVSSSTHSQGNAGNVTVKSGTLKIDSQDYLLGSTGIASQVNRGSAGNAGNIAIQTRTLDILNGGSISSHTFASGKAGNLSLHSGTLNILNGGNISSSTFEQGGNAGNIEVTADALTINNSQNNAIATGIVSLAHPNSGGHAGNITLQSGTIDILNGGVISNSTSAQGDAGNIEVTADTLTIKGQAWTIDDEGTIKPSSSGIFSQALIGFGYADKGNAGNVTIQAGKLDILNGGLISNSTFSLGDAGNIKVTADSLTINSQGYSSSVTGIVSRANDGSSGEAGSVDIRAKTFDILNGGKVSTSSVTQGDAGSINISADTLTINGLGNGFETGIISEAHLGSSGQAGQINVKASNAIQLSNGGKISTDNAGNAADLNTITPSNIAVIAPDIDMKTQGTISTNSTGNIAAGNIDLSVSHWLTMSSASIISTTADNSGGGNITIKAGGELIRMQNARVKTSVYTGSHKGGDIAMTADVLVMANGLIQANADSASGGDITMDLGALIPSSNSLILGGATVDKQPAVSLIQAASNAHLDGKLNVTAPQLNLSGIIANLGNPLFDATIISQDYCGQGIGSTLTRKGDGGIKPNSGDQLLY